MAVKNVAVYSIVMADKPWIWIISYIKVVKYWKSNWELFYGAVYKDKINTCTFFF